MSPAWAIVFTITLLAQIDPRSALLERTGWDALAAGRPAEAAAAFRDALAGDPRNARLHLGAAMAAALDRRDADAKAACERALGLDPSLRAARALLGQILYRMKDLAAAIRAYEALAADTTGDPRSTRDIRATLDRWQRESALHERMQQSIGAHFTVSFEGPEDAAVAARAIELLDRSYWRVGQLLGVYPTDPIGVTLYTREQFRDITRSPSWAAGAYDGIIRVPIRGADDESELERVLAHEFVHALIRTVAARGVPTWLNEGLASALESGDLAWAERQIARGRAIPLRTLHAGWSRLGGEQAALAYATSAIAARRLLEESGGAAVVNLLRDVGDGVAFETAFLHRIQRPFAEFEANLF